jgi:hypothetical protein
MNSKRLTAEEALAIGLNARRTIEGRLDQCDVNYEIARNVLHEELGYIGERREPYHFDEETRDILIAHSRQDAAHALRNSMTILQQQKVQRRLTVAALVLLSYLAVVATLLLL